MYVAIQCYEFIDVIIEHSVTLSPPDALPVAWLGDQLEPNAYNFALHIFTPSLRIEKKAEITENWANSTS